MKGRRGLTLIETLLALGLTLVVGTLVVEVLIPAMERTQKVSQRAGVQTRLAVTLDRLESDLQRSSLVGVSLLPGDGTQATAVALVPIVETTPQGTLVWGQELILYFALPGEQALYHRVVKEGLEFSLSRPPRLGHDELAALCSGADSRVLLRGVERFGVTHQGGALPQEPLGFLLRCSADIMGRPETFELRRSFSFRNPGSSG